MEGYYQTTEEQLAVVKQQIKKANLKKSFTESPIWGVFKEALDNGISSMLYKLRTPDNVEYKSGQYDAFCQMIDWANAIEKDLKFLPERRVELEVQSGREQQKGVANGRG